MTPSQQYLDEERDWGEISSIINQLMSNAEATAHDLKHELHHGTTLINNLSNEQESLHTKAEQISSSITAKIEVENNAFENESNELANQIRAVQSLEAQVEKETNRAAELLSEQQETKQYIQAYKAEVAEEAEALDDIEIKHSRQLRKNHREISYYAQATNIKWDYSRADVLAGEVSLPKKFEHRKFCVEKDLPECEIAEKLWGVIEG